MKDTRPEAVKQIMTIAIAWIRLFISLSRHLWPGFQDCYVSVYDGTSLQSVVRTITIKLLCARLRRQPQPIEEGDCLNGPHTVISAIANEHVIVNSDVAADLARIQFTAVYVTKSQHRLN